MAERLVTIGTYPSEAAAQIARMALEQEGIAALVLGASSFGLWDLTTSVVLQVGEHDVERATVVLNELAGSAVSNPQENQTAVADWKCACGESVPGNFDFCWKCAKPRTADVAPAALEPSADDGGDEFRVEIPRYSLATLFVIMTLTAAAAALAKWYGWWFLFAATFFTVLALIAAGTAGIARNFQSHTLVQIVQPSEWKSDRLVLYILFALLLAFFVFF